MCTTAYWINPSQFIIRNDDPDQLQGKDDKEKIDQKNNETLSVLY